MTDKTIRYFDRKFKLPFAKSLDRAGDWQLPVIPPCHILPKGVVAYDQIKVSTPRDLFVVFHCWDDRIENTWIDSESAIKKLSRFNGVFMPDFSMLTDMDFPLCVYNLWRCRVLARWFLENEIEVLPSAKWWNEKSLEHCFDGLPKHSLISVSNVATVRSRECDRLFRIGYERMLQVLDPAGVILYGSIPRIPYPGPKPYFFQNTHHSGEGLSYLGIEQQQLKEEE